MACDAPQATPGGTFTCAGGTTNWNGVCNLECDSSSGYTGDTQITCNVDDEDETVSWSATPVCTGKCVHIHLFVV